MTTRQLLDDKGIIDRKIRENQSLRNTCKANSNRLGDFRTNTKTQQRRQIYVINFTNWVGRPNASKQTLKNNTDLSPLLLFSVSATLAQQNKTPPTKALFLISLVSETLSEYKVQAHAFTRQHTCTQTHSPSSAVLH